MSGLDFFVKKWTTYSGFLRLVFREGCWMLRMSVTGLITILAIGFAGTAAATDPQLIGQSAAPSFVDTAVGTLLPPLAPTNRPIPPDHTKSGLQKLSSNLGHNLSIFGLDFFRDPPSTFAPLEQTAPAGDYRISTGDVLDVKVWGAVTILQRVHVDGSGQIFLPQVGPVSVAGIRFADLDAHLKSAISRQFRNFEIQTSLARQKTLQIYVTGQARAPGAYSVGGFSSLINALLASGGPTSNGSLRRIELRRGKNVVGRFDLYSLLLRGDKSGDLSLQTGDVIHIPAAKSQVAVVNGVAHPAIYEINEGETLYDLIQWAGGLSLGIDAGEFRRERIVPDSGLKVERSPLVDSGRTCVLGDGDIFEFAGVTPRFENAVTLRGHVRQPGRSPWKQGMRVSDLLPQMKDLIPDAFWERLNIQSEGANFAGLSDERRLEINWEYALIERMSPDSLRVDMIPFNLEQAIRRPKSDADALLEPGDMVTIFGAGDIAVPVQYRPIYIQLAGEVKRGGVYKVRFGETLKDVLRRADGLTSNAFVFGSKLLRKSTKEIQTANYKQVVDEMERQFESNVGNILSGASSTEQSRLLQSQVEAQRKWFAQLKEFVPEGRLVLELDPGDDLDESDLPDIVLEDGDIFSVPPAPSTISVFGEVARQTAFLYRKGRDVGDYLSSAGGATRYADESQAFVMRADGSLVGESEYGFLFWQLPSMSVLPGDAVVVPRKLETSTWMAQLKDWTQILANFGLSAAAIATLTR